MKTLIRLAAAALLCAPAAFGAVSPEEAARLGAELTPLGGEKAANTDGSIPAWTGGLKSAAEAGFPRHHARDHYPDPYARRKPPWRCSGTTSRVIGAWRRRGRWGRLRSPPAAPTRWSTSRRSSTFSTTSRA